MFRPPTASSFARKRMIAPTLESLEIRQLLASKPASQVSIVEIPPSTGSSEYTLAVVGTSKNDSILIVDNGKHQAGSLMISASGNINYTSQHPIGSIEVLTGAGKDTLVYELQGDLQPTASEALFAVRGGSIPGSTKSIQGGGTLQMTVNILGKVMKDSALLVIAAPDPKAATTLNVNDSGEIDGNFTSVVENIDNPSSKKLGPVNFKFNSSATIGSTGALATGTFAGSSQNSIAVNYNGTNNGDLLVLARGSGAKDNISANVLMSPTSTGTVGLNSISYAEGDGKSPKVLFAIARGADSTSKTGVNAVIRTTSPKSVTVHTANVVSLAAGRDSIIS